MVDVVDDVAVFVIFDRPLTISNQAVNDLVRVLGVNSELNR